MIGMLSKLLKPRTHEQIRYSLFAQILADLLHSDPKIAQIKGNLFAHVYKALGRN